MSMRFTSAQSPTGRRAWRAAVPTAAVLALFIGGCGSVSARPSPGVKATPSGMLMPAPDPVAAAALQQEEYRIGPLDTLDISVFQVENLKQTVRVDANGMIDFPLIGLIKASTRTPRQLSEDIGAKLGERYLQSPQVTVFVKESISQRFTVEGSVKQPGVFPILGPMTLLQAIATAHGLDEIADLKGVVVFRMINQQRMAATVNIAEVRTGKQPDPRIYPGDVIVVAESGSRRALRNIVGVTPLFSFLTPFGL